MFDQLPDLYFMLLVIIPKYSRIAKSTYTRVCNTFNDAISCLKMCIDLYTRSTYTRVYTVIGKHILNTFAQRLLGGKG